MSRLEDDGGREVIAIEEVNSAERRQALWVGVGPVWFGSRSALEPGIWISYQSQYMESSLAGPVLLDAATWDELDAAVRKRIRHHRRDIWLRRRGLRRARMMASAIKWASVPRMRGATIGTMRTRRRRPPGVPVLPVVR